MERLTTTALVFALLGLGCSAPVAAPTASVLDVEPPAPAVEQAVLSLVSDGGADALFLSTDIGMNEATANAIVEWRFGADGVEGTPDDRAFEVLEELDRVPGVDQHVVDALGVYAEAHGLVALQDGTWEDVSFSAYEVSVMLDLVNEATMSELDDDARLDKRAAEGIVDARPIADMDALADAYYVGHAAMEHLKAWLPAWLERGTADLEVYDGVAFTHQEAASALAAANNADRDMYEGVGIRGWQQNLLMQNWFASLEAVADTTGIGPLTMQRLRELGNAGWPNVEPWYMTGTDALAIADEVSSELGGADWSMAMQQAIGDDASGDPDFPAATTDAIASHIVARTGSFASDKIGATFSSRKAAKNLVKAYAQGLESAATIDYPHGALTFVPALDTDAKIERARQAFLYYWEHTVVNDELFYIWHENDPNGVPTWADLEEEVTNDLYNGNFPYMTEELPDDSTATAMYGDVYYWFHEIHIDALGKATYVFVEYD